MLPSMWFWGTEPIVVSKIGNPRAVAGWWGWAEMVYRAAYVCS